MSRTLKDLVRETRVFYAPGCKAKPISWRYGAVEIIQGQGAFDIGFELRGLLLKSAFELPTELFNHQLMACDCSNLESLREFVSLWGVPYSPYRYYDGKEGFRLLDRGKARQEAKEAFELTDRLTGDSLNPIISVKEASHTIRRLQWAVTELRKAIMGDPFEDFTTTLNAATCNGFRAAIMSGAISRTVTRTNPYAPWETERLTCAICNQIVEAIANEKPWRLCACEGCGVVFKSRADTDNSRGNAKYCSLVCQKRQDQRNKREAAKNRIDHGL